MQGNPENGKHHTGAVLRKIPFLSCLSDDDAAEILQIIRTKRYTRGQIILLEQDSANYMYIVFSGRVRVLQLSDDGKEHLLAIHKRGDYFGEMALFDGKAAPATVVAMEESEIGLLYKSDFEAFVVKNEKVLYQFINMLCARLRESWMMLKVMRVADAEQRVRVVLKHMGRLYGVRDQRGVLVSLKLTHKDIADYAAVSRETVSRLLGRFTREGEIEILDRKYILMKSSFLKHHLSL
jgi:CRP/FNR family transcriptional regulator